MKTRSKMILGLASLLGVTAGATAVSGFAWFVTTKTATIDVTNIGVYNNNPSLSVELANLKGVKRTNDTENDFDLEAAKDSTSVDKTFTADGNTNDFVLPNKPLSAPAVYIDGVEDTTLHTYIADTKTIHFENKPAADTKIRAVYYDDAALTDVSSIDGINVYDPTWETAYEGRRATKIPAAKAGEQYISFDLQFAAASSGSLKVFLDRPTITGKASDDAAVTARNDAAADVARVAFSTEADGNILTLSRKAADAKYQKGISKNLVEHYPGDPDIQNDPEANKNAFETAGDYAISAVLDDCAHLVAPSQTNYSVMSTAPEANAANNHVVTVTNTPVTVHVSIWLEGTANTDTKGNFSTPIGGEINVKLNLVAFGA